MAEPGEHEADPGAAGGVSEAGSSSNARLLVLPETFDGSGNWDERVFHFENVAAVNRCDDTDKLW